MIPDVSTRNGAAVMKVTFDRKELYEKILEENGSFIYLADMESYELVYLTASSLRILGFPPDDKSYIGKKCYEVLQGKTEPCEFCSNCKLTESEFYVWEHFNAWLNRHFAIRDKIIRLSGRALRMEIAEDVSGIFEERRKLEKDLNEEKTLMNCIQSMMAAESDDRSVRELLEKLCMMYDGDRGYIFQFDYELETSTNTYEWCRQGIRPEIDNLQNLPLQEAKVWIDIFKQGSGVCIDDLERERSHDCYEYQLLAPQGITSLVVVPLLKENQIIGLMGVDNPRKKPDDLSLMKMIAQFVSNDIEKRRILKELEKSSQIDLLSKVFNQNRYLMDLEKLIGEKERPIGVIFLDLNNLKEINDTCGHDIGDELIRKTASILYTVFPKEVYRIGGDEFVVLSRITEAENFYGKAESLREQFGKEKVQISMGVDWYSGGDSLRESISRADERMYVEKAKSKSGNIRSKPYKNMGVSERAAGTVENNAGKM